MSVAGSFLVDWVTEVQLAANKIREVQKQLTTSHHKTVYKSQLVNSSNYKIKLYYI